MEGFIGQIMLFASNFAPRNWAFCEGQLLPISQNTALFSILGTTYGGDGRTTFALPDFRGRAAVSEGIGPGLSPHRLGAKGGQETVTLNTTQIPQHDHTYTPKGSSSAPTTDSPAGNALGGDVDIYSPSGGGNTNMAPSSTLSTGGNQPHNNQQPTLALNYVICLQGVFPSRS